MRTEVVMNSSDFEVLLADDVYLTFYDTDTCSRIQIKLQEHVARKFKKKLEGLLIE